MADVPAPQYPTFQPPAQNALLANPVAALGLGMRLQEFGAQRAAGQAFQGAVDPSTGQIDPDTALRAIAANPAAALAAPEASTRLLALRGQQINNATAQLGLMAGQNDAAASYLTSLYGKTLGPNDVNVARSRLAAMGIPPNVLGGINSPAQLQNAVDAATRMRAGAGTLISPTPGATTPEGMPTVAPLGATVGMGARGVGLPATVNADLQAYNADKTASGNLFASTRPLEKALPLLNLMSNTDFGPASKGWAEARSLLTTLGIAPDSITNAQSMREEVAKYLNQAARSLPGSQRSDEAQAIAKLASPNLDLTQSANRKLVNSVIGMIRQDAAVAGAAGGPLNYNAYKGKFYNSTDSRAFEPMTKADLKDYYDSIKNDPAALAKARRSIVAARQFGGATAPTE